MKLYKVKTFKVFLRTRDELLKMGYEDNHDKDDFLNALSGHIVTINYESEDGDVFTCVEYPEYAIYDYLIKGVQTHVVSSEESTFAEIGVGLNYSTQSAWNICKQSIKKLKELSSCYPELSTY